MPDSPPSWLSPKTLTLIANVGIGSVIALWAFFMGSQYLPATKALAEDILQRVGVLESDHKALRETLIPKVEEGNRIQCAQCWNSADTPDEVKRCSCSPDR